MHFTLLPWQACFTHTITATSIGASEVKALDLLAICSKEGVQAAIQQWYAGKAQGDFAPEKLTRRDVLDLQIWSAILMKVEGSLTPEFLEKCEESVELAQIPPKTQVVYVMFMGDLAWEAGLRGLQFKRTFRAKGFDWELADALSNISANFDKRVATIRKAAPAAPPAKR